MAGGARAPSGPRVDQACPAGILVGPAAVRAVVRLFLHLRPGWLATHLAVVRRRVLLNPLALAGWNGSSARGAGSAVQPGARRFRSECDAPESALAWSRCGGVR